MKKTQPSNVVKGYISRLIATKKSLSQLILLCFTFLVIDYILIVTTFGPHTDHSRKATSTGPGVQKTVSTIMSKAGNRHRHARRNARTQKQIDQRKRSWTDKQHTMERKAYKGIAPFRKTNAVDFKDHADRG